MDTLKNLITRKYIIAVAVIALLDTMSFISILTAISINKDNAHLINISGRQRMLSQRITLFINQISSLDDSEINRHKNEALKNIQLFNDSHLILTHQSSEEIRKIPKHILDFYFQDNGLDQKSLYFISQVKQFLEAPTIDKKELYSFSEFVKRDLLNQLDHAVKLFEKVSNDLRDALVYIEVFIFLLSFLNLAVILKFIFTPMRDDIVVRESQLTELVSKLQAEGEYKSMFLANMGHELRTPLNGILGVVDLMHDSDLSEEQYKLTSIIEESGKNLLHIVNDILDLTKLEMGQVSIEKKDFSLEGLLKNISQVFEIQSTQKKLNYEWEKSELPPIVNGDEHKLKLVLNNLLGNALKFTDRGSIKLVTYFDDFTSQFIAKVHDTGIGIPPEKIDLIFDPFKQADASTTRLYGGTGLGLSISKQLVESMGGTLKVSSQLGVGSTFTLTLPLGHKYQKTDTEYLEQTQESVESFHGNILLIEENDLNRNLLTRLITRFGPLVESVISLKVAHRLIQNRSYNIILISDNSSRENIFESLEDFLNQTSDATSVYLLSQDEDIKIHPQIAEKIEGIIPLPLRKDKLLSIMRMKLNIRDRKDH